MDLEAYRGAQVQKVPGSFANLQSLRRKQLRERRAKKRTVEEARSLVLFDRRCPVGSSCGASRNIFLEIVGMLYPQSPVDEAGVDVAFAFARGQALAAAIPEAAIGEASIPELEASDPADPADASTSCVDGSVVDVGNRRSYYAFEDADVLFVFLDPWWYRDGAGRG